MTDRPGSPFEVEATSIEEFLRLLRGREGSASSSGSPARRAVFVASLKDVSGSRYAFPKVTRRVVAAFAYGPDIVSYERVTSNAVELPEVAKELADKQRGTVERLRAKIERGIEDSDLGVPVREGRLRRPADPRQGK